MVLKHETAVEKCSIAEQGDRYLAGRRGPVDSLVSLIAVHVGGMQGHAVEDARLHWVLRTAGCDLKGRPRRVSAYVTAAVSLDTPKLVSKSLLPEAQSMPTRCLLFLSTKASRKARACCSRKKLAEPLLGSTPNARHRGLHWWGKRPSAQATREGSEASCAIHCYGCHVILRARYQSISAVRGYGAGT